MREILFVTIVLSYDHHNTLSVSFNGNHNKQFENDFQNLETLAILISMPYQMRRNRIMFACCDILVNFWSLTNWKAWELFWIDHKNDEEIFSS